MKVIIPTAGEGRRLQPFTHTLPKVLLQVADRPILGHILDALMEHGFAEVTIVVGYMGEKIVEYVRRSYPALKADFVEQEEAASGGNAPYGLGYAIYLTHTLHEAANEPILIILGDTIIQTDFARLRNSETTLIGVQEVEDPRRFGIVELDGDRISAMVEKPERPKTNLAVCGIYLIREPALLYQALRENIRKGVLTKGEVQLTDALQGMLDRGALMRSFKVDGWYDCGKPETLLTTNQVLLRKRFMEQAEELRARYPTLIVKPPVYVAPTARIHHAILGPDVAVGGNVELSSSIVTDSIINADAQVHNALLGHSIIGAGARVKGTALHLYVGDKSEIKFE